MARKNHNLINKARASCANRRHESQRIVGVLSRTGRGGAASMVAKDAASRIGWVDYSKGICIVAVVCLYTTLHLHGAEGEQSWMQYWVDFARPFRMPDFFLMAGLFLRLTINKPWPVYFDRKVVH